MQLSNRDDNYGIIAKLFHWLMALLVVIMLIVGLTMTSLEMGPDKLKLYGLHKSTGAVILVLVILRSLWRQLNYQPPIPEAKGQGFMSSPRIFKLMQFAADASHAALYVMLFLMPLTGWLMTSAYGFPVSVYGLFTLPNLVSPDRDLAETLVRVHDIGAFILIGLVVLHVSAALFHHFVLKDIVLKRMLPWGRLLPVFLLLGLATPALAAAPGFTVDKGKSSIKFEAVQNDAPVSGEFKDYVAQINFSDSDLANSKAVVEVKTASLVATYDEMVKNLQGADWLDVKAFPAAKFATSKFTKLSIDEYEADGNLTIRDQTKPVKFKFKLVMQGNIATVDGAFTIKRSEFGVGQGEWKNTSAVKDEVKISVHLVATKV